MSATTSKLEMSLDDIIKAQKGKGQAQVGKKVGGAIGGRRGGPVKKGQFGRRPIGGGVVKRPIGGINRKRIGQIKGKRLATPMKRMVTRNAVGRRPIGNRFGGVRKNVPIGGNKAVITATKNLVKKLVKKALANNVTTSLAANRGKLVRVPANRIRQQRTATLVLNKIANRSRVIGRRRVVAVQNSPILVQQPRGIVRGRGAVRFAVDPVVQMQPRAQRVFTSPPKRRQQQIQYVQQPAAMVIRQQPAAAFLGSRAFQPQQQQQQVRAFSVRQQINAMRRATQVHQLNTQFLRQQQQQVRRQQQVLVQQQQRQQPVRRQQQVIAVQQRRLPARRRQQQPQQVIILQQQAPQRRRGQQQQRGGGQRRQQVLQLDPLYCPPNFLQRI